MVAWWHVGSSLESLRPVFSLVYYSLQLLFVGFSLLGKGCAFLISMYYKRHELQKRWTFFFSSGLVAGAFGGVSQCILCICVADLVDSCWHSL